MKNLTTTTTGAILANGNYLVNEVIVHTATSCHEIDRVLCKINAGNIGNVAKLILQMHAAIQRAEQFISGFEDDETQTGVDDTLEMLRVFDLK